MRKYSGLAMRPSSFEFDGLIFNVAEIAKPLAHRFENRFGQLWKSGVQKPDYRHSRNLLRPRHKRPRRSATKKPDEFASLHMVAGGNAASLSKA